MQFIKGDNDLPRHIVNMLRLDYFDDAVGHVEGFQIFGDLMQHGNESPLSFMMTLLIHSS